MGTEIIGKLEAISAVSAWLRKNYKNKTFKPISEADVKLLFVPALRAEYSCAGTWEARVGVVDQAALTIANSLYDQTVRDYGRAQRSGQFAGMRPVMPRKNDFIRWELIERKADFEFDTGWLVAGRIDSSDYSSLGLDKLVSSFSGFPISKSDERLGSGHLLSPIDTKFISNLESEQIEQQIKTRALRTLKNNYDEFKIQNISWRATIDQKDIGYLPIYIAEVRTNDKAFRLCVDGWAGKTVSGKIPNLLGHASSGFLVLLGLSSAIAALFFFLQYQVEQGQKGKADQVTAGVVAGNTPPTGAAIVSRESVQNQPSLGVPDPKLVESLRFTIFDEVSRCLNVGSLSDETKEGVIIKLTVVIGENGVPDASRIRMTEIIEGDHRSAGEFFEATRRAVIRCGAMGFSLPTQDLPLLNKVELTFDIRDFL